MLNISVAAGGTMIFENNTSSNYGTLGSYADSTTVISAEKGSLLDFRGNTSGYGGAIFSESSIIFNITGDTIRFTNNEATTRGGAIYNRGKMAMNVANLEFIGNKAATDGGAIFNSGTLSLTNGVFKLSLIHI